MKLLKTLFILFIFSFCVTSCTELEDDTETILTIENTQATGDDAVENGNGGKGG
jgi:hypothetical protein